METQPISMRVQLKTAAALRLYPLAPERHKRLGRVQMPGSDVGSPANSVRQLLPHEAGTELPADHEAPALQLKLQTEITSDGKCSFHQLCVGGRRQLPL
jgi:hypothetical protein